MKTIMIDILIALAIAAAGGLLVYRHLAPKVAAAEAKTAIATKALETAQAVNKVSDASTAQLASKNAATARKTASAQASLHAAAASAPSWAQAVVPPDVQAAIAAAGAPSGASE